MEPFELATRRLLLRHWRLEDHKPFASLCADAEVMRWIGDGSTRTAQQASAAIARFEKEWDERGYGLFAIELRETGEFIGFTGLSRPSFLPEVLPSMEIGWRLARAHWGLGYATEAALAALAFGVRLPVTEEIVSICQAGNVASSRIMRKIGLEFDCRTIDQTCNRPVEVYRLPQ